MTNVLTEILTMNESIVLAIALLITALTGILKLPIKKWAEKAPERSKYTRFITFLPIILGFILSVTYDLVFCRKEFCFDEELVKLWMSSSSLSLAIYAFIDKFIPSKKKILTEIEIKENLEAYKKIREALDCFQNDEVEANNGNVAVDGKDANEKDVEILNNKIMIGNTYDKTM